MISYSLPLYIILNNNMSKIKHFNFYKQNNSELTLISVYLIFSASSNILLNHPTTVKCAILNSFLPTNILCIGIDIIFSRLFFYLMIHQFIFSDEEILLQKSGQHGHIHGVYNHEQGATWNEKPGFILCHNQLNHLKVDPSI